jgi:hypothetical protein
LPGAVEVTGIGGDFRGLERISGLSCDRARDQDSCHGAEQYRVRGSEEAPFAGA